MFKSEYSIFLGKEDDTHFVELLIEDNLYLILEVIDGATKDEIRDQFKKIKEKIASGKIDSLKVFEDLIEGELLSIFEKETFSLAAGLAVGKVFYLMTAGEGQIFIKRQGKLEQLIYGENKASGILEDSDIFVLVSNTFSSLIEKENLNSHIGDKTPKEILEDLTPTLKEKDDLGAIAVFLRWHKELPAVDEVREDEEEITSEASEPSGKRRLDLGYFLDILASLRENLVSRRTSSGRKLTFLVVVVLLVIFIWSVIFGFQRRAHSEVMKKIDQSSELIEAKLNEASDIQSLNLDRAMILLSEAKDELKKVKEVVGGKEVDEVKKIEEKIAQKEKEIIKKDEKKEEEFYDLALIEKGATGEKMYLDGENAAILNPDDGKIYILSLTKKSTRTVKKDGIKGADLVALYNEDIVFLNKDKGIYKVASDDKSRQVIKKDEDWGDLVGVWIYNGNLYFLDREKDEIYKYLVGGDSYSSKSSYFRGGQSVDLDAATSLAIDSDVYVGTKDGVYKYTGGIRQEFNTKFPDEGERNLTKIFTDKNNNKIYALEKESGKVYIISKNGTYEKQIESAIFKKASDFVVLESQKSIYVLVSDKIYTVGIE